MNVTSLPARHAFAGERAVDDDLNAVYLDVTTLAEVDHHVPVKAALVAVATFGITGAQGEVHRAPDLLVKEGVAGVLLDVVVRADRVLADVATAGVHVEHG